MVGRKNEQRELRDALSRDEAQLIAVYGIRRVGKTYLVREKVAFLSSRKVPTAAVMLSLDWAAKVRDAGICVIGGFQSALEKDVLRVLLKEGSQPGVARQAGRI